MPKLRFRCHCTKCQSVYRAPFSDAVVFRRGQVRLETPGEVDWVRMMRPTPLVRGVCKTCRDPVLAQFYGVFSIIPASILAVDVAPRVSHDIFYRTRVESMGDTVPKHDTMLRSYLGLAVPFVGVLALPGRPICVSQ
ncbi:MAG: GFA family protein [Rhodobacteraceae bacterium]|nr:GFA family protein [Paracoccaceae bacterium]